MCKELGCVYFQKGKKDMETMHAHVYSMDKILCLCAHTNTLCLARPPPHAPTHTHVHTHTHTDRQTDRQTDTHTHARKQATSLPYIKIFTCQKCMHVCACERETERVIR